MSHLPAEFPEDRQFDEPHSQNAHAAEQTDEAEQMDPADQSQPMQASGEMQPRDNEPFFCQVLMEPQPPPERIPNFGHLGILFLLALLGLFSAIMLARVGIYFHLFGVSTVPQAANEIHYTLGTEGLFYLLTYAGAAALFPALWGRSLLSGLQWRARVAGRRMGYLFSAAGACFLLAILNSVLIPGPENAPIDKIFRMPGAAWVLFLFGITFAPFFEEIAFRGFLLPALATAFDWSAEQFTHRLPNPPDRNGHPNWSLPAMASASIITSILFALLHAEQTASAIGPFLLLVCVSLVLCGVRLLFRSLAASVFVHACYNFLLFSLMFLGTSGFRHLDNM
ncbi:MAG TPA: CPBP family intramembrane glutamic endopeptidase [Terracidiphilus sp.]|nr:CPBP family intramembrane glutamic endopeptidase [Terracidiphilus sp.]